MKYLLMVCCFLYYGCSAYTAWQHRETTNKFVQCVYYVKDPRTNLCFAYDTCGYGMILVDPKYCGQ